MAKLTKKAFIDALKEMTIQEVMDLIAGMKEEFDIDPTQITAGPAKVVEEEVEEKTEFNVKLISFGANKVQVIKVIKAATNLGLMDAKKMTESAPVDVKENISKEDAEALLKLLIEAGAEAKIE